MEVTDPDAVGQGLGRSPNNGRVAVGSGAVPAGHGHLLRDRRSQRRLPLRRRRFHRPARNAQRARRPEPTGGPSVGGHLTVSLVVALIAGFVGVRLSGRVGLRPTLAGDPPWPRRHRRPSAATPPGGPGRRAHHRHPRRPKRDRRRHEHAAHRQRRGSHQPPCRRRRHQDLGASGQRWPGVPLGWKVTSKSPAVQVRFQTRALPKEAASWLKGSPSGTPSLRIRAPSSSSAMDRRERFCGVARG